MLAVRRDGGAPDGGAVSGAGTLSAALARYIPPTRAGDPLGLGLPRPSPPPDPDPHDLAAENKGYARSTLTPEDRAALDETISREGYMSIEEVRLLIAKNAGAEATEIGGLDPGMIMLLDMRIDYKIFVAGDNVYTREELFDSYPFHELQMVPEAVFAQQEVGIFPPERYSLDPNELNYIARDAGDETIEFVMIEDMVARAVRKNHQMRRAPLRVVKTKVYVGREPWEDFKAMQQLLRGTIRAARTQNACGKGGPSQGGLLALLAGGVGGAAPLMIENAETIAAERRARADEDARREEELRRREEELRRHEEETRQRIAADMARLEKMLATATKAAAPTKPVASAKPAASAKLPVVPAKSAMMPAKSTVAPAKSAAAPTPSKSTVAPSKSTVTPSEPMAVAPAKPTAAAVPAKPAAATKPTATTKPSEKPQTAAPDYDVLFAEMFPDGDSVPL